MVLEFVKMNGAGNDFVLIDNRSRKARLQTEQIVQICDRQKGVGADGIILLVPCESGKADWAWQFYNRDGSEAEMCGNGARCFARYIQKLTGASGSVSFETAAGVIMAGLEGDRVTINLTEPRDLKLNQTAPLTHGTVTLHSVNTGVPHAVLFVPDADQAMVQNWGSEIRNHPHFAQRGTNVNFVQLLGPGAIRVRTYERGVEGETLACGTGVAASALIASRVNGFSSPVKVQVQGGDQMEVRFQDKDGAFTNVTLTGPADFTFEGRMEI